mgnify:CR=1 FL=1
MLKLGAEKICPCKGSIFKLCLIHPSIGQVGIGKVSVVCKDAVHGSFLHKGGVRADGAEIVPNDAPEIMQLLSDLWATGCTKKVTEGVLAAESIWGENLNNIPGLADAVKGYLDAIQEKGMMEVVKSIL